MLDLVDNSWYNTIINLKTCGTKREYIPKASLIQFELLGSIGVRFPCYLVSQASCAPEVAVHDYE
jgi:hypothetical protein